MDHHPNVVWEVTKACALGCRQCPIGATTSRANNELSTYEAYKTIDQIAAVKPSRFLITGGDPLLRQDIYQIVEYACRRDLQPVLALSATPRLDRGSMERLRRNGLRRISISIDDFAAERHDGVRGIDGNLTATLSAVEWARDCGMAVEVDTLVTDDNVPYLGGLLDLIETLGADAWNLYFAVPIGASKSVHVPSPGAADQVFAFVDSEAAKRVHVRILEAPQYRRYHREHGGNGGTDSVAQSPAVFIAHNGDVRPGEFIPLGAGNVRYRSLAAIYRGGDVFVALRDPRNLKGRCGHCRDSATCGGSRARAFATTGDLFADDPLCAYDVTSAH